VRGEEKKEGRRKGYEGRKGGRKERMNE